MALHGTITINGIALKSVDQCLVGGVVTAGSYYALDPFGEAPRVGAPEYEELPITFPGVDGVGIKRFGFRGRDIFVTAVLIGATKNVVEGQWTALANASTQLNRYTITFPGATAYNGCKLMHGGGRLTRWMNFNGFVIGIADLDYRQLSTTN